MGGLFKLLAGIFLILIILILSLMYIKQNPPKENVYISSNLPQKEFSLFNAEEIQKISPPTPTMPLITPLSLTSTISTPTSETYKTPSLEEFETTSEPETQTIKIIAKEYKFEPDVIKVKAGEKISIIIKNEGLTPHDFKISNEIFSIKTDLIAPGGETKLDFILPKKGEYEFYCTLHIDKGMKGKIIAE